MCQGGKLYQVAFVGIIVNTLFNLRFLKKYSGRKRNVNISWNEWKTKGRFLQWIFKWNILGSHNLVNKATENLKEPGESLTNLIEKNNLAKTVLKKLPDCPISVKKIMWKFIKAVDEMLHRWIFLIFSLFNENKTKIVTKIFVTI